MTLRPHKQRCAIYTRKSSEEGLEQDFNSLDAQREACEACITSQRHEGWHLVPRHYDDGGISGGTLERPGLQALLAEIQAGRIDIIVVYKIDRLTRSLTDFARLADMFDHHGTSFVSVTQQFNTTTSMGRLMLNVLLSFAQFEREVTGERIRDKIAASKKKGMWMGGLVPLGYDTQDRKLVINEPEAETIRTLYRLYLASGNVRKVVLEAKRLGLKTKARPGPDGQPVSGRPFSRGHIYRILANPLYIGRIIHGKKSYPGLHEAIIDPDTWQAVQQKLADGRNGHRSGATSGTASLLKGLLFNEQGTRYTPSHANKAGRRYRYYIESNLVDGIHPQNEGRHRIPAREIEAHVEHTVIGMLDAPDQLMAALGESLQAPNITHILQQAKALYHHLQGLARHQLVPALRPLIQHVTLYEEKITIGINRQALRSALELPEKAQDTPVHTLELQTRITTRGEKLKIIVHNDNGQAAHTPDPVLANIIARAYDWQQRLQQGEATSIREIAEAEKLTPSYVTRILRLAFLAPDIIEAILKGRQPVEITTKDLLLCHSLPMDWSAQRKLLGFPASSFVPPKRPHRDCIADQRQNSPKDLSPGLVHRPDLPTTL